MARILIAGCGYVGSALGQSLALDAHDVWGLRRRPASLPLGVRPISADLAVPGTLKDLPPDLDAVFYMAAPGGRDDALYRVAYVDGLRSLLDALDAQGQRPGRVFFTSSTSVYAQRRGEEVDEASPTEPSHFGGRRLLEAEALLASGPFPSTVVRFAGIYGPRRQRLIDLVRTGRAEYRDVSPPRYTNRIHRDDCVGVLRHLMALQAPESLYVGVDSEPAPERTVMLWLAGALGAPAPRAVREDKEESERPRGNKRCRNARLLASGYAFQYPTFREGYSALIQG